MSISVSVHPFMCRGNPEKNNNLLIIFVCYVGLLGFAGGVQSTYSTMEFKRRLRKYYAKSLAKLQIEFVKSMPTKVKDFICLLKYWKYTEEVSLPIIPIVEYKIFRFVC